MPPKKSIKTPSLEDLDETEDCSSKEESTLRSKSLNKKRDVKSVSKSKEGVKFFVIGDTHFRLRFLKEGNEFINACVSQVRKCKPDFIVCLGDTLDTHADVNVLVYNVAYDFFKQLGSIAPVYVLIGNHDLINGSQCLTTNHIFNALKDLREEFQITLVDDLFIGTISDYKFLFVPYVPKNRFLEVLNENNIDFSTISAVFAHQEIAGVHMNTIVSDSTDEWPADYPPLISGHIHEEQIIGEGSNVYYPGSSMQLSYEESAKNVWLVTYSPGGDDSKKLDIQKYNLGIQTKKQILIDASDFESFDTSRLKNTIVRLKIRGTTEDFKIIRKSKKFKELKNYNVKICYDSISTPKEERLLNEGLNLESLNYFSILDAIVERSDDKYVHKAYKLLKEES